MGKGISRDQCALSVYIIEESVVSCWWQSLRNQKLVDVNSDHWWGGSGHQWDYLESQRTSRRVFEVLGGCVKVFGGDSMEVIGESMLSDHFGMSGCWWHHREGWVDITENKGWRWGLSLRIGNYWQVMADFGREIGRRTWGISECQSENEGIWGHWDFMGKLLK